MHEPARRLRALIPTTSTRMMIAATGKRYATKGQVGADQRIERVRHLPLPSKGRNDHGCHLADEWRRGDDMRRIAVASVLLVTCAGAGLAQRPSGNDWRRLATPADRQRLRAWRSAWTDALVTARTDPRANALIIAEPTLFDPDRTLMDAVPPPGPYRCRTFRLGRRGMSGPPFLVQPWVGCRIGAGSLPVSFVGLGAGQRPTGTFYADTDARAIFLGTLTLADEARAMAYGRDGGRDMAGIVERIGERRWRLVLPQPAFQSQLDLIELRPVDQGAEAADVVGSGGNVAR